MHIRKLKKYPGKYDLAHYKVLFEKMIKKADFKLSDTVLDLNHCNYLHCRQMI